LAKPHNYNLQGEQAYTSASYGTALNHFQKALLMAEKEGQRDLTYKAMNKYANLLIVMGRNEESIKLLLNYQDSIIKYNGKVSEQYIHLLENLGLAYASISDISAAFIYFRESIALSNNLHTENDARTGCLYRHLSSCHQFNRQYDSAYYFANKAVTICENDKQHLKGIPIEEVYTEFGFAFKQKPLAAQPAIQRQLEILDSAALFFRKGAELSRRKFPNGSWIEALALHQIGNTFNDKIKLINDDNSPLKEFLKEIKHFDFDNYDVLERLLDVFENEFKNFTYDIDKDSKKIINYENLLLANTNFLKFLIPFIKENISNENEIIYSTDITDKKSIFDFIDSYLKTKPSFDFLNYKFLWSLSSGQNAFLNIFSRIYELINRDVNRFSKLKNNIILMIDEGDVCFHPQWQKEYLNTLLNFLPFIFERESKDRLISLQIILTSSSPIVISDIPRNNIIFLQRNSDGKCEIIEHLEDKKQTFSSNIHTLFSDSFFMKDGLIGEFAKKKINSVIKDLDSNEKLSDNRIEEIKKIISVIGEPIVKRKLMQMLEDKSKLDINYKERLSQIEEELKNLRERNDKN